MTWTVSISDFRRNISDYLDKVGRGDSIVLKDGKKNREVALVSPRKVFDQKRYHREYAKMLKRVAGTFTAKNHPEWATRAKVEKWLRQSRLADERTQERFPRRINKN